MKGLSSDAVVLAALINVTAFSNNLSCVASSNMFSSRLRASAFVALLVRDGYLVRLNRTLAEVEITLQSHCGSVSPSAPKY